MNRPRALSRDIKSLVFLVSGMALLFAAIIWLVYQAMVTYNRAAEQLGRDAALLTEESVRLLQEGDAGAAKLAPSILQLRDDLRAVAVYDATGALFARRILAPDVGVPTRFSGAYATCNTSSPT